MSDTQNVLFTGFTESMYMTFLQFRSTGQEEDRRTDMQMDQYCCSGVGSAAGKKKMRGLDGEAQNVKCARPPKSIMARKITYAPHNP